MQKEITRDYMVKNAGCYSDGETLNSKLDKHFKKNEVLTLDAILNSRIPIKDKYWFVCKRLATKEQNQLIAIGVAEIVLEIYENKYPGNKAPREAIQAAKDYLAGIINIDELRRKRYAAAAADDAAAAAYAADDAAAYAADDAAYAAYAADDDADKFSRSLLIFLKKFCQNA